MKNLYTEKHARTTQNNKKNWVVILMFFVYRFLGKNYKVKRDKTGCFYLESRRNFIYTRDIERWRNR